MKKLEAIIKQCCDADNRHEWANWISVQALHDWYENIRASKTGEEFEDDDSELYCPVCGEMLQVKSENVGFDDQPHIEIWRVCPNHCLN